MIVYAITNKRNGKRYIGMTSSTAERRFAGHWREVAFGSPLAIHRAMRKYGRDAFEVEEVCALLPGLTREELGALERAVIDQEGTLRPAGYNVSPGGDGGWFEEFNRSRAGQPSPKRGVPMTEAQKRKLAANWTAEKRAAFSEQQKALFAAKPKRISANRGKKLSDAQRAKLVAAWSRNPQRRVEQSQRNLVNKESLFKKKVA